MYIFVIAVLKLDGIAKMQALNTVLLPLGVSLVAWFVVEILGM